MLETHMTTGKPPKSNEWYTPLKYIQAVREVMGTIDLDPASCEAANKTVQATHYFTQEDDGLRQSWLINGHPVRVFCNPPYGGSTGNVSIIEQWIRKVQREFAEGHISEAVLLPPVDIDSRWFLLLWDYPICFTAKRIRFTRPNQRATAAQRQGNCFVYIGPSKQRFIDVFSQFGVVAQRVSTPPSKSALPQLF